MAHPCTPWPGSQGCDLSGDQQRHDRPVRDEDTDSATTPPAPATARSCRLATARGPALGRAAHRARLRPDLDPAGPTGMGPGPPGRRHRTPGVRADHQRAPGIRPDSRCSHRAVAGFRLRTSRDLVWDPSPQPPTPAKPGQDAEEAGACCSSKPSASSGGGTSPPAPLPAATLARWSGPSSGEASVLQGSREVEHSELGFSL